jgi:hypothetical protein
VIVFRETDQIVKVCEIKEDILDIEEESTDEKVLPDLNELENPLIDLCREEACGMESDDSDLKETLKLIQKRDVS